MRRIALVHEWLDGFAGSEKVLEQMLAVYPEADLFCTVDFMSPQDRAFLGDRACTTTFIQKLPWARRFFRSYLPLMPLAIEQLDLSAYDLVLSSTHAVAKGVITGPDQLHVSYVHSPIRYAWDLQNQYLRESGLTRGFKSWLARGLLHYLRLWDLRTANGVDHFIANSQFIRRRIAKVYRREAAVVYPPVDVGRFTPGVGPREDFYLTASRLVPYKKVLLIVQAFARMSHRRLVVIGDGPDMHKLCREAGANVTLLGYQAHEALVDHMQRARAFVFAAEEDFGITPLEAQACGTPVIALGKGGSLETVRHWGNPAERTGLLFATQTVEAIIGAVEQFEAKAVAYDAQSCRRHAEKFSPEVFRECFRAQVEGAWQGFQQDRNKQWEAEGQGQVITLADPGTRPRRSGAQ